MSIVRKLQKKCLSKDENLQDLLREALLISTKLKLNDFKLWINSELKGYEDNIPDYREVQTRLKFFNPYHGWKPAIIEDKKLADIFSKTRIGQPIGELENILQRGEADLHLNLSPQNISELMKVFSTTCEPSQLIDRTQIYGITEQVRTLLLEWSLKLEEDGILGNEDLIFSEEEKEAAKNFHIENYGVIGNVEKLGNMSTGSNSNNTYIENNIDNKIDELINEIKALKLQDEKDIIIDLEASKNDKEKAKTVLGGLLTRGAEIGTIGSMIISILGLLG
ncbi:MAG: hypothetical protein KAQ94_02805 [Arcobacteraceae bacterium]|nr:hypothetical protein [Arcobacteraceae bacterium]